VKSSPEIHRNYRDYRHDFQGNRKNPRRRGRQTPTGRRHIQGNRSSRGSIPSSSPASVLILGREDNTPGLLGQSNGTRSAPVGAARWGLEFGLSMTRPSPLLCFFLRLSIFLEWRRKRRRTWNSEARSRGKFGFRKGREGCLPWLRHRRRGDAGYSWEHHTAQASIPFGREAWLGWLAGRAPVAFSPSSSLALPQLAFPFPSSFPFFLRRRRNEPTRGRTGNPVLQARAASLLGARCYSGKASVTLSSRHQPPVLEVFTCFISFSFLLFCFLLFFQVFFFHLLLYFLWRSYVDNYFIKIVQKEY